MTRTPAKPKRAKRPDPPAEAAPASDSVAFPIAGVGASAGGFEAITELLAALPPEPGVAIALVLHMDAGHDRDLARLLARHTSLPVEEIAHGTVPAPDHVYVIPPQSLLYLKDGVFQLRPRGPEPGHAYVIDRFFRSLADELGPRAAGVVLSGTLTDGTNGIQAIHAGGGRTFAQAPETAKFPDMPRSAIASQCVDGVLAPNLIAQELATLSEHAQRQEKAQAEDEKADGRPSKELAEIFSIVRKTSGVDFSQYKPSSLRRRIARRMAATRATTLKEYVAILRSLPEEPVALFDDLLIQVTRFFRDVATFEVLRRDILPRIVKDRPADLPIRVWVPGCATGEEAYSIAITVLEFLEEHGLRFPLQVFATDVSERAVLTAREGTYPETITDDVSPNRLQRHFERVAGRYQIVRAVRAVCVFAVHDLARDPPFSSMDLVSCRNVLIYMNRDLQRRAFAIFHYSLREGGHLLLGTSEAVGRSNDLFTPLGTDNLAFVKKHVSVAPILEFTAVDRGLRLARMSLPPPGHSATVQKEADRVLMDRFAPPAVVVNANLDIVHFRGQTAPFLEHAPGPASLNLNKLARPGLAHEVLAAVVEAAKKQTTVRRDSIRVGTAEAPLVTGLEVTPLPAAVGGEPYYIAAFLGAHADPRPTPPLSKVGGEPTGKGWGWRRKWVSNASDYIANLEREVSVLQLSLQSIMEEHRGAVDELQAVNEEALSVNEELQATNEELETAKEELQSTNEELTTLNDELRDRTSEVQKTNDDLMNLLTSVSIPIVILGPRLQIRRFTPSAAELLKILPTDVGRPLLDLNLPLAMPKLEEEMQRVLRTLQVRELKGKSRSGKRHTVRIQPYRTADQRIEGLVLVIWDAKTPP